MPDREDVKGPIESLLDPTDWDAFGNLARRMTDDMVGYLATIRERAPWTAMPESAKKALDEDVPQDGIPLEAVYDTFRRYILPYPTGNIHPRFWGWVMGTGTPSAMLADMLASGMNSHVAGYDQSAAHVERLVCRWLVKQMGFPTESSSVLVSGGTAANLNGLTCALVAKSGFDIRAEGVRAGPPLTVYGSAQTHSWAIKSCETLGLGSKAFRAIPVDSDYRIDVDACRMKIVEDRSNGLKPICIIGNAGTVNTGAIDDLQTLRTLATEQDLWFHIDGAFGALAAWTDSKELVRGQEQADSLAFDLHKWGYLPYDVGVAITRRPDAQLAAYAPRQDAGPAYLQSSRRGIAVNSTYFADRGLQLSRGFRALKVWMAMKEYGVRRIGRAIQRNIVQAKVLEGLVQLSPQLELLAPVELNVVCFRYNNGIGDTALLNELNAQILVELQERGIAVPSQTVLKGRYAIRVCITNHRSQNRDFEDLVRSVVTLGEEIRRRPFGS